MTDRERPNFLQHVTWENGTGMRFDITIEEAQAWQAAGVQGRYRIVTVYEPEVGEWKLVESPSVMAGNTNCVPLEEWYDTHDAITEESINNRECGWCAEVKPVAYTDVLDIDWCEDCYAQTFLENWNPMYHHKDSGRRCVQQKDGKWTYIASQECYRVHP